MRPGAHLGWLVLASTNGPHPRALPRWRIAVDLTHGSPRREVPANTPPQSRTPNGSDSRKSRPAAPSRSVAMVAFADWAAAETEPVTRAEWQLWAEICRAAYEPNALRQAAGRLRVWYSDLAKRAGLGRTSTAAAMRRFRAAGLLDGAPCEPDPTNDWHRERATYRVTVPAVCRQVLARLAYKARRAFDEATTRVATAVHRAVVTPLEGSIGLVTAPLGPVDGPRGYPDDYLRARGRR